jgi:two-component system sensor histidine kinase QseC
VNATSLQRELISRVLFATLSLACVAGAGIYLYARHALVMQYDAVTISKARAFASLVEVSPGGELNIEASPASVPEYYRPSVDEVFELRHEDGSIMASSPALRGASLMPEARAPGEAFDLVLPDGRTGRGVVVVIEPWVVPAPPGQEAAILRVPHERFTLALARDRSTLDRMLNLLLTTLSMAGLALAAGTALAVVMVVRKTLEPVQAVATQAGRIDATTLDRRLPLHGLAPELRPICQCINELLERVEAGFKRERQFTANVAHELRTPIAELRALAEVAINRAKRGGAEPDVTYRDALDIARQMESTVTALLALARCTGGTQTASRTIVDVSEIVQGAWRRFAAGAEARGLSATCDVPAGVLGLTDRALFAAVVENLLSNAVEYAPRGGMLRCRMERSGGRVVFSVTNTATDLTADDVARMCEPFWRKDDARSSSVSAHAGLGLALVEAYTRLLDIDLKLRLEPGNLFVTTIALPAAAPATLSVQPAKAPTHRDAPLAARSA